jgi:hypothetical protein
MWSRGSSVTAEVEVYEQSNKRIYTARIAYFFYSSRRNIVFTYSKFGPAIAKGFAEQGNAGRSIDRIDKNVSIWASVRSGAHIPYAKYVQKQGILEDSQSSEMSYWIP